VRAGLRRISIVVRANDSISPMFSLANKHALPALCIHAYRCVTPDRLISSVRYVCYIGKYDLFLIILTRMRQPLRRGVSNLFVLSQIIPVGPLYCPDYRFRLFLSILSITERPMSRCRLIFTTITESYEDDASYRI